MILFIMDLDKSYDDLEQEFLTNARNGELECMKNILEKQEWCGVVLDINCKGKTRSTKGWTPLHLASYFGHTAVVELLAEHGADVNVLNDVGDTPLHRAAYTGRLEVVQLLLRYDADVFVINSEGMSPSMVAKTDEIKNMIEAAEEFEQRKIENDFLNYAREGETEKLEEMIRSDKPPNINCCDKYGNTSLHLAAYRHKPAVAVILLQNGIDTSLKNSRDQTALDMASDMQMKQLLDVKPIKELYKSVERFEGPLLKKTRFVGWKPVWVVLERGVISLFRSRADATTGARRKNFHYLDEAKFQISKEPHLFTVHFSDTSTWSFSVDPDLTAQLTRQKWENALKEHASYSTQFLHNGCKYSDEDNDTEEMLPLGSLQDVLQTATAHQHILEKQVQEVTTVISELSEERIDSNQIVALAQVKQQLNQIVDTSRDMSSSLTHCLTVFNQQEEVRKLQLQQESEKCRVLQDALHVLAKEQYHLERALFTDRLNSNQAMFEVSDDEEFFDCADEDVNGKYTPYQKDKMKKSSSRTSMSSTNSDKLSKWGSRRTLPVPMFQRNDFSVWSILKQCIGKELSKITMPVIFNEPLSFLQRIVEYTEYATLLRKANECEDPVRRLEYVTAFAVSATASNWERIGKPFNPLLGETYELDREDLGFRIVCEQVSHHPPVSAFHTESDFYTLHGAIHPKLKFWGKSVEVTPKGTLTLHLRKYDEVYTWQNVNCCVHNIIVGKLWIEHYGAMEITNQKTKMKAVLNFKPSGWFGKDLHKVEGYIYDRSKKKLRALYGKWVEALYSHDVEIWETFVKKAGKSMDALAQAALSPNPRANGTTNDTPCSGSPSAESGEDKKGSSNDLQVPDEVPVKGSTCNLNLPEQYLLWEATPKPKEAQQYYQFTHFAMMLNELKPEMLDTMPPTDSRFRPDMRKMEEGDIDRAAEEKNRLEEKQRASRKDRKKRKDDWKPLYFNQETNPHTGKEDWLFNGRYWRRNWEQCPDIF